MATNKPSCALTLTIIIQLVEIAYLLFVGYYWSFQENRQRMISKIDQ